jgi:hypothetical protein
VSDIEQGIREFKALVANFESRNDLEALNAIVELSPDLASMFEHADDLDDPRRIRKNIAFFKRTNPGYVPIYKAKMVAIGGIVLGPEDATKYKIRMAAKIDLIPIAEKLRSFSTRQDLKAEYLRLSRAVGIISNKRVDHDRGPSFNAIISS